MKIVALAICMLILTACATVEKNTYSTFGQMAVKYDTIGQSLEKMKKDGKIKDAEWKKI